MKKTEYENGKNDDNGLAERGNKWFIAFVYSEIQVSHLGNLNCLQTNKQTNELTKYQNKTCDM